MALPLIPLIGAGAKAVGGYAARRGATRAVAGAATRQAGGTAAQRAGVAGGTTAATINHHNPNMLSGTIDNLSGAFDRSNTPSGGNNLPTFTGDINDWAGQGTSNNNPTITGASGNTGGTAGQQAAAGARQAAIQNLIDQQNQARGSVAGNLNQWGSQYDARGRDMVNQLSDQQGEINRGLAGNTHNLNATMDSIVKAAQRGLRSGGVALAGMNASDSGAVDAMGRAYADVSNSQAGEANAQFGDVYDELMRGQSQLNRDRKNQFADFKTDANNQIEAQRLNLQNDLGRLDMDARNQGVDWRANQGLVDQVINDAMSRLQARQQQTNQGLQGIQQWGGDRVAQEAMQMREAGQPGRQFSFSRPGVSFGSQGELPGQAQVPLFVRNRDDLTQVLPGQRDERR